MLRKCNTYKLKASALLNSVTTCLIVALFSSAIIMLWYYNRTLIHQYDNEIDIIIANQYATQYFQAIHANDITANNTEFAPFEHNGIQSTYRLRPWGIYNVLTVTSRQKKDSISKSFLLGNTQKKDSTLGLYVVNNGRPLKYAGKTRLSENIIIPNRNLVAHFLPQKKNALKHSGKTYSSTNRLPEIAIKEGIETIKNTEVKYLEEVLSDSKILVNSFDNTTIEVLVQTSTPIEGITLKGNVVISSTKEIVFGKTAHIQDVIIQAPKVRFLEGFQGNAQVISTEEISLEDTAILSYPSSIYTAVKEDSISVHLNGASKLYGSLVMNSNSTIHGRKGNVFIDTDAMIIGDILSYGIVDFRGTLYGSAYINSVHYKTKTNTVDNLIVDARIQSDSIPDHFVRLPLVKDKEFINYEIIKAL